jgi:serine O-acetyltransferase
MSSTLQGFLDTLAAERRQGHPTLGLRRVSETFAWDVLALLFPQFSPKRQCDAGDLAADFASTRAALDDALTIVSDGPLGLTLEHVSPVIADRFMDQLPALRESMLLDAQALFAGDPAARSVDEVVLAYPGFLATALYRVAHALHVLGVPLVPRLVSELGHRETGIDIHPAARIGRSLAIDHGTGAVIGESAVIGDRVKLYQGVTLGALSVRKALADTKRHPTLEDDVVVYANATILGGDTIVGAGSVIGGNVWLTKSVPPRSVVTHDQMVSRARQHDEYELEFHI